MKSINVYGAAGCARITVLVDKEDYAPAQLNTYTVMADASGLIRFENEHAKLLLGAVPHNGAAALTVTFENYAHIEHLSVEEMPINMVVSEGSARLHIGRNLRTLRDRNKRYMFVVRNTFIHVGDNATLAPDRHDMVAGQQPKTKMTNMLIADNAYVVTKSLPKLLSTSMEIGKNAVAFYPEDEPLPRRYAAADTPPNEGDVQFLRTLRKV